jgi:hypothetical protein
MIYLKQGKTIHKLKDIDAVCEFLGANETGQRAKVQRAVDGELFNLYGYDFHKTLKSANAKPKPQPLRPYTRIPNIEGSIGRRKAVVNLYRTTDDPCMRLTIERYAPHWVQDIKDGIA